MKTQNLVLCVLCALLASCKLPENPGFTTTARVKSIFKVRTTAYTHSEGDHLAYGRRNATGTRLRDGKVRSAAADWSVFPVGTTFKIEGDPALYIVDDYGSALVGTGTIDIYQPTRAAMDRWGVRRVNINVVKWGSFDRSLSIMKDRTGYSHIRKMVLQIAANTGSEA